MSDPDVPLQPHRHSEPSLREQRLAVRAIFLRKVAIGSVIASLALALIGIGYIVVAIRMGQVENTARAKSTNAAAIAAKSASDRIEECTTPGESCYERGQSQTTSAVVDVNRVTVLAAYCANRGPGQTVQQIRSCVLAGLGDPRTTLPRIPSALTSPAATTTSSPPTSSSSSSPRPSGKSTPRPRATSSTTPGPTPSSPSTSTPASSPTPRSTPTLLCLLQLCLP